MKRILKKILGILLVLIGLCYDFCYADMIADSTYTVVQTAWLSWLGIVIIGTIIMVMSIISFFLLKTVAKKDNNIEENKKKLNKTGNRIYVWGIILAIMGHLLSLLYFGFNKLLFCIPIIIFIVSIIMRKKIKKISNILCIISICIICVIPIVCSIKENAVEQYNSKFPDSYKGLNYNDVIELINKVTENNETNKNKITVKYNYKEYKTSVELNNLIHILNKKYEYYISTNGFSHGREYITEIEVHERN